MTKAKLSKSKSVFSAMSEERAQRRPRTRSTVKVLPGEAIYSMQNFTSSQREFVQRHVSEAIEELDLKVSLVPKPQLGSRVLSKSSTQGYHSGLRQLEYFLSLIGDWSSIIILRRDAPEFAPSIRVSSLVSFIDWKYGDQGSPMVDESGSPMQDVFGRPLLCDGCWTSPHNTTPFSAAVSNLHIARGFKSMPYSEPCSRCLEKFERSNDQGGCYHHAGRPLLWRKGNTRFAEQYANRIRRLFVVEARGYQAQGDSALTPHELIKIRSYLMSKNCISAFRLWTMILVSVKQLRRGDEVVSLDLDQHFLPDLTTIRNGRVVHFCLLVDGKTDSTPAILSVHLDDDIPELCLVRQLLAWIWVSKYQGGPLFPSDTEADDPVAMSKAKFLKDYQNVCQQITGRRGPFGTHTGRKTAWLLGAWAGASDTSLASDSRHKDLSQACRYKQDAMGLLEIARANE